MLRAWPSVENTRLNGGKNYLDLSLPACRFFDLIDPDVAPSVEAHGLHDGCNARQRRPQSFDRVSRSVVQHFSFAFVELDSSYDINWYCVIHTRQATQWRIRSRFAVNEKWIQPFS